MSRKLNPIAAYDIRPDGSVGPVVEDWPSAEPNGEGWRWVHCDRTDPNFVLWAAEHVPVPFRAALREVETRPRAVVTNNELLVTLRGINLNDGAEIEDMVAIRLWVSERLVVSTRFRRLFAVDELKENITSGGAPPSPVAFVARLAGMLSAKIEEVSAAREEATDEVEETLLDEEPDAIGTGEREVSRLARSIIKLRRHIAPQREALAQMATMDLPLIGSAERYELRDVANRATRIVEELDASRERLASLRQHIDSLHSARIGKQSFVLSVVAAIFLPLSFITGLLGVNVAGVPATDWEPAFWVLTVSMAVLGILLWFLFRWLKWF